MNCSHELLLFPWLLFLGVALTLFFVGRFFSFVLFVPLLENRSTISLQKASRLLPLPSGISLCSVN